MSLLRSATRWNSSSRRICYLHPELRTAADFAGLRLNTDVLRDQLNPARLADYQTLFAHQRLNQRIEALLSLVPVHA